MKSQKLVLLLVTLILVLVIYAPVASATASIPGSVPIPTPPPVRWVKPDLMFVSTGCITAPNGGRLLTFTIKNDTLIGFGLGSGAFIIRIFRVLPWGQVAVLLQQTSLAPQTIGAYRVTVSNPGWYEIRLDSLNQVDEFNEGNNIQKVPCP